MNPASARALVPPRPNPGPEPWTDPAPIALYLRTRLDARSGLVVSWFAWRRLGRNEGLGGPWSQLSSQTRPTPHPAADWSRISAVDARRPGRSIRTSLESQDQRGTVGRAPARGIARTRSASRTDSVFSMILIASNSHPNVPTIIKNGSKQQLAAWEPRIAEFEKKIQAKPERRLKNGAADPDSAQDPARSRPDRSTTTTPIRNE